MSKENLISSKKKTANAQPPKAKDQTDRKKSEEKSNVIQLERKGSLPLAQLKEDEKELFSLIDGGDVAAVKKFLEAHKSLNVNCVNYMGQSGLHIAIQNENVDIVTFLFSRPDLEYQDAALQAVATGNVDLAKTILDAIKKINPGAEKQGCEYSADYSADITPFILAAQMGDYKMVRMLLELGHEIQKPHIPSCFCDECKRQHRAAGAAQSRIRLNAYKAICSPSYICQVTDDPILYSFTLDSELAESALIDKEFMSEYRDLSESVRQFTVDLLSLCRNTSEIEILLKLPFGFNVEYERAEFPRLQLAIDYHQKEFVAHSMVQQVLTAYWLGEFISWPRLSLFFKCLHVLFRILMLPVISFALMFTPDIKLLRKYRSPLNRFLMHLASYLLFLLLIFELNYKDIGRFRRGPPTTQLEPIIVIFVLGYIWSTMRKYWIEGGRRFCRAIWNWYDIAMYFFFFLSFIFWSKSFFDVQDDHIHKKKTLTRKFWHKHDSTLLHEGFFSIATVLTFGKMTYFFLQSSRLGPLQVSLGKMAIQIGFFLAMCLLINSAFAIPLTRMYAYYNGMTQYTKSGTRTQLSSFSTVSNSFLTLFWGMLGMSPVESTDVVIENLTDDKTNPVINTHNFTEGVGLSLFAIYELLMIIALVNTLIAILSNTFQKIIDNADVEFKFARTKQWMYFFDTSTKLPSPFNLIPTLEGILSCGHYFQVLTNKVPGAKLRFSFRRCCYIEYKSKTEVDETAYEALMSNIVQRYFRAEEQETED